MSISSKTFLATLAAGASLLVAGAARADNSLALANRPPVAVTACQVDYRVNFPTTTYGYTQIREVAGLDVSFHNERSIDANEVDLQVDYDGTQTTIADKGVFAPSTTIVHAFNALNGSFYGNRTPDRCNVVAVHYADGSVWHANAGTPVAQALATSNTRK